MFSENAIPLRDRAPLRGGEVSEKVCAFATRGIRQSRPLLSEHVLSSSSWRNLKLYE